MNETIGQVVHPCGTRCDVVVNGRFPTGLYRVDLYDAETGEPAGQVGKNLGVPGLGAWLTDNSRLPDGRYGKYTFIKNSMEMNGILPRLAGAGLIEMTGIKASSGWIEMELVRIVMPEEKES